MLEQKERKRSKSAGTLIGVAVVAILIIAPLGSYFYLKQGFVYRLESLEQLKEKEIDQELQTFIQQHAPFNNNARLIHIPGNNIKGELNLIHSIDDQIVDRDRFEIISFSTGDSREIKRDIQFINTEDNITGDFQFILIDTSNVVRAVYPFKEEVGKEIVRHLAVVIPMPRRRSIHLNREKE